jgi:hypothetical protein
VQGVGSHNVDHGVKYDLETNIGDVIDRHLGTTLLYAIFIVFIDITIDRLTTSPKRFKVRNFPSARKTCNEVYIFHSDRQ